MQGMAKRRPNRYCCRLSSGAPDQQTSGEMLMAVGTRFRAAALALALALIDLASAAQAQPADYPNRPVRLVASGRLRALAVTGLRRNPSVPDVPTFAEAGYPNFEVNSSFRNFCWPLRSTAKCDPNYGISPA
jgi:hypothetical protein